MHSSQIGFKGDAIHYNTAEVSLFRAQIGCFYLLQDWLNAQPISRNPYIFEFHFSIFEGPGFIGNIATIIWSRAAQALAPRVEYWPATSSVELNLRFIWNLVLGIWDFIGFLIKDVSFLNIQSKCGYPV